MFSVLRAVSTSFYLWQVVDHLHGTCMHGTIFRLNRQKVVPFSWGQQSIYNNAVTVGDMPFLFRFIVLPTRHPSSSVHAYFADYFFICSVARGEEI